MAKVGMWSWATRDAAASSCVLRGFEAHSRTSAPPACRVCIRFAVSVVTCRQAAMRTPRRGRSLANRSEEHTSELQSLAYLVCRLLLEKKKNIIQELSVLELG